MKKRTKADLEQLDTNALIYELLAERVGAVDPHFVFYAKKIDSGKDAGKYSATLGSKKLTPNQVLNLRTEAQTLEKMELWKLFTQTLAHDANLRMFRQAKTERDLDWGKAILYSISIFEAIVNALKSEQV